MEDLADTPVNAADIRSMDISASERIEMPQVTRGQAHYNTFISLAELSFTLNGKGFYNNGQAPNSSVKCCVLLVLFVLLFN